MRFYIPIPFSEWHLMFEWYWWNKGIYKVHKINGGFLGDYKTIWKKKQE